MTTCLRFIFHQIVQLDEHLYFYLVQNMRGNSKALCNGLNELGIAGIIILNYQKILLKIMTNLVVFPFFISLSFLLSFFPLKILILW
ncbi:unnamed protein product [Absidia cylindrospora]